MLLVPRAVRLAAWASAVLAGRADPADLARAVRDPDDDGHRVTGPDGDTGDLTDLLAALSDGGAPGLRAVLPVPGDVSGLPGPPSFNVAACDAGECAVTVSRGPLGAGSAGRSAQALGVVPQAVTFGSPLEPGVIVDWAVHRVTPRPDLDVVDLGEADRRLRRALSEATAVLGELDLARWRPEVAERWGDLSAAVLDPHALPPQWPGRALQVLATALRLRAIIDLALADDGGAISGWEAERRRTALRGLDGVARRAAAAAAGPHGRPDGPG